MAVSRYRIAGVTLGALLFTVPRAAQVAPATDLFLLPRGVELTQATPLHEYSSSILVRLPRAELLPQRLLSQLFRLPAASVMSYRGSELACEPTSLSHLEQLPDGSYLLGMIGPPDAAWLAAMSELDVVILDRAFPYGVLVRAAGDALAATTKLATSRGYSIVRCITPLPSELRLSRDLRQAVSRGESGLLEVRLLPVGGQQLLYRDLLERGKATGVRRTAGSVLAFIDRADLSELLDQLGSVAFVEPVASPEPHNNLVVQESLLCVVPVWDQLGSAGEGVIIAHNDTGVELTHPDLAGRVLATAGTMEFTNNAHGTHTAGSILGGGSEQAPGNDSGCGDLIQAEELVRGVAYSARLVSNNLFNEGYREIVEMMRWGADNGALISANSWGFSGDLDIVFAYSGESAAVDAAVRDALPQTPEADPLMIVFSASNRGPDPSTVTGPGNAKNALTVGASQNLRCGSYVPALEAGPDETQVLSISGRGPAQERIKPDVVAPGSDVLSLESGDELASSSDDEPWTGPRYSLRTGTSMASALVAGAAAVFAQARYEHSARWPSPALIKAGLINGAVDTGVGYPSMSQGWGRVNLDRALNGPPGGRISYLDQSAVQPLVTGETWSTPMTVFSAATPLKITLVWTDPPGEEDSEHPLRNDLDLVVTAPDGSVFRGNQFVDSWSQADPGSARDSVNNVENVLVAAPPAGEWLIAVVGVSVVEVPPGATGQDYAVVYSGDAWACEQPPPPSGLDAAIAGDNQVKLTWDPVVGASEYEVLRAERSGGRPYLPLARVTDAATTYLDTSVSGSLTYYYVVRARRQCWTEPSAEVEVQAQGSCTVPPEFGGVAEVVNLQGTTCSLELRWLPADARCGGAVSYEVWRGGAGMSKFAQAQLIAEGVTGTSFVDRGLGDGQEYAYLVRAINDGNGQQESNTVLRRGMPSGRETVFVEDDTEAGGAAWLAEPGSELDETQSPWQLVDDLRHSGTHAWFCADADQLKDQVLVLDQTLRFASQIPVRLEFWHRYQFEDLWDGGRIEYSVDGGFSWHDILAGDGFSIAANSSRFIAGRYPKTLRARASGNPLGGGQAYTGKQLPWSKVEIDLRDFAEHDLLLRLRLGCDQAASVEHGWWIDDLRVAATEPCQQCLAPAPMSTPTIDASAQGLLLSWLPAASAQQYRVYRSTGTGGPYEQVATLGPEATSYLDAEVSGGTQYFYMLRYSTGCWSEPSAEVTAEALGSCTLSPTFYGIRHAVDQQQLECSIELSWDPGVARCNDSSVLYRVYRGHGGSGGGQMQLLADGINGSGYTDVSVFHQTPYSYLVRAYDVVSGQEDENPKVMTASASGPQRVLFDDDMENGEGGWSTGTGSSWDSGTSPWTLVEGEAHSAAAAWYCANEETIKDQVLELPGEVLIPDEDTIELVFWHRFSLEVLWDGGRLEYSVDQGQSWHDILDGDGVAIPANAERFLTRGYSGGLFDLPATNPLSGEQAWTGSSDWSMVRVSLRDFRGKHLLLRWRLGCNSARAWQGWWIDDVKITYVARCAARPRVPSGRKR